MEVFNNGLEALLRLLVEALAFARHPRFAPELHVFPGGFLWLDVLTTHVLPMPVPAGVLWWGSATCIFLIAGSRHLTIRRVHADSIRRADVDVTHGSSFGGASRTASMRDAVEAPSRKSIVTLSPPFRWSSRPASCRSPDETTKPTACRLPYFPGTWSAIPSRPRCGCWSPFSPGTARYARPDDWRGSPPACSPGICSPRPFSLPCPFRTSSVGAQSPWP